MEKAAHKIQAPVAMEQRAKAPGKVTSSSVYRTYINAMKKKTKKENEDQLKGNMKFKITAKPANVKVPSARGMLVGSKMSEGVNDPTFLRQCLWQVARQWQKFCCTEITRRHRITSCE